MDIQRLPVEPRAEIGADRIEEKNEGKSGDRVFKLEGGKDFRFLKMSSAQSRAILQREFQVLTWLEEQAFHFSPKPLRLISTPDQDFLFSTALKGHPLAGDALSDTDVATCAALLRRLHCLPIAGCPFSRSIESVLVTARQRVADGLADESDFDEERLGWSATDVLGELVRTKPPAVDPVFTHGDFSPTNILTDGQRLTGLVDWGRAGVADRYHDLAIFCRYLKHPQAKALFLTAYGIKNPDIARMRFYELLDELF